MGAKWNRRYNRRLDTTHRPIADGLRAAGVRVYEIGEPCDLLCQFYCPRHKQWCWQTLEAKTLYGKRDPKVRVDKRQDAQIEFLALTQTPVCVTVTEALLALSLHGIVGEPSRNSA